MKKTKTIEVTVCDVCGKEAYSVTTCPICKKDTCSDCKFELYRLQPMHNWTESNMGSSYGTNYISIASMCKTCFDKTIKLLVKQNDKI